MPKTSSKFIFFASIIGNILEYYDFTIYAVFATDMGRIFFPKYSEFAQILCSLGVFASGFFTRPIGGILFGYLGDRYGRRMALIISMLGITIPTCIIGLLPSYQVIGIAAPLLLIAMRLLQGLCISGEGTGAAIFILEHDRRLKPGLTTSVVNASNIAGTLLATLVGIFVAKYCKDIDMAWRLAFLVGAALMGMVGFYLRLRLSETPVFKILALQKKTLKAPFVQVFRTAKQAMFLTLCVGALASTPIYFVKAYVIVYYRDMLHVDDALASTYMLYTNFIVMVTMPFVGMLADSIGPLKTIVLTTTMLLLFILPTLCIMTSPMLVHPIIALTLLGMLAGAAAGPAYLFVISLFRPEQRFSGVAFSYNAGIALFGSTTPIVSRLVAQTGTLYAPAFYIMTIAIFSLLVIGMMRKKILLLMEQASG